MDNTFPLIHSNSISISRMFKAPPLDLSRIKIYIVAWDVSKVSMKHFIAPTHSRLKVVVLHSVNLSLAPL